MSRCVRAWNRWQPDHQPTTMGSFFLWMIRGSSIYRYRLEAGGSIGTTMSRRTEPRAMFAGWFPPSGSPTKDTPWSYVTLHCLEMYVSTDELKRAKQISLSLRSLSSS